MNYFLEDLWEMIKRNYISIGAIVIAILSIVGSVIFVQVNLDSCEECEVCVYNEPDNEEPVSEPSPKLLTVDVKGAVKKPGVYELEDGKNIQDALNAAGGVNTNGSTANINLSKKISDEMVVYVFTKDELKKKETANEVVCEIPKCECETITVTECPVVNKTDTEKPSSSENSNTSKKVSINTAKLEELTTIDGIGEAKAKAIIEYREKNGLFASIEDIQKVSGIGETLYEKIKDQIVL